MEAGKKYPVNETVALTSPYTGEGHHFHYVGGRFVPEDQWRALQDELNDPNSTKQHIRDESGVHKHQEDGTAVTEYINVIYRVLSEQGTDSEADFQI